MADFLAFSKMAAKFPNFSHDTGIETHKSLILVYNNSCTGPSNTIFALNYPLLSVYWDKEEDSYDFLIIAFILGLFKMAANNNFAVIFIFLELNRIEVWILCLFLCL